MDGPVCAVNQGLGLWTDQTHLRLSPLEAVGSRTGFVMPYQYPLPPMPHATGTAAAAVPLAYLPDANLPLPGNDPKHLAKDNAPTKPLRDRKEAISQGNQKLRRSVSTNDASMSRQPGSSPVHSALSSDKKRNKLGYHRTSVACVHCRRRKIRCIVETADKTGSCINCVRLKRECSFISADQPTAPDNRSKTSSRESTRPQVVSASSSPAPPAGMTSAIAPPNPQFQGLAMAPAHNVPQLSSDSELEPDLYAQNTKGIPGAEMASRPFDFGQQPLMNWAAPDTSPASTSKSLDLNMPWRPYPSHDSPMTPSFSPYTPNAPLPSASWGVPAQEGQQRDDMVWGAYAPAHPRSTPFAGDGRNSPHASVMPRQVRQIERRIARTPSEGYASPAAVVMPGNVGVSAPGMSQNLPPAAATVPSNDFGAWNPQHQFQYARPQPGVAGWGFPTNLGMPTSDQIPTSSEEDPTHSMGMYYTAR